ncbi:putative translation elongation factor 1-beta [Leishmania infantum JPCM5]|uniref:Translation_elongation_factor_1-beta_-_putative n=2 Tax=Leishmania infantum TaxID=5671 RepID=A0A6L0XWG8_LEIIN|nr:putative translation elongation factor 1-beta [Leishmania infantum JPCM5]CAC9549597.1 translation_elongation_factor_1-beta_-_putative [Leishmania infantum]CAM72843.1 putative translation elongation factor 1-beta [Leishmania infantum JPCM5]SUZ46521.1 translation_elongation_factor_1-beta_-_putative [Leishmania infantum]|eukprot:XP_001469731.1 putative translation elongation factor 1-beta [Leishmania infantum JPCM5]
MSTLKEVNGRLNAQPFVSGFSPSSEDARIFNEMFGSNVNVIQWVARMASYYQAERDEILNAGTEKKATESAKKAAAPAPAAAAAAEEEDDIDLFGETTEEEKAALEAKKAKDAEKKKAKTDVIAKSSILFDIKAWDDTIDLEALAQKLHAIQRDGLIWGDHKLVPVAFGVKKLQQLIVIEDDKVSGDDLEEMIMGFEDEVQSMDIVAWNKI